MRFFVGLLAATVLLFSSSAFAQARWAPPPDDYPNPPPRYLEPAASTFRLSIGPALRATSARADGGFGAALDIGAHAAGARFAGNWIRVGSERGLSQYGGELWLDFGSQERLHPIVGAGAGIARLEYQDATSHLRAATVGIGTLRGTLEYELPIREANARCGLDVVGALPAIRGQGAPDVNGWLLFMARVGVGF